MTSATKDFVRLAIRERRDGTFVSLIGLRTTVEYYGWDQTFPQWMGKYSGKTLPGQIVPLQKGGNVFGGTRRPLVICRSDDKHSTPQGLTNRFRVTTDATFADLINIAQATQRMFGWMTSFHGKRIRYEEWMLADLPDSYLSCDRCYGITAA